MEKPFIYNILGFFYVIILLNVDADSQHVHVSLGTTNDSLTAISDHTYYCGSDTQLTCTIINDILYKQAQWVKYSGSDVIVLKQTPLQKGNERHIVFNTNVNGGGLYSCQYDDPKTISQPQYTLNITITVQDSIDGCQNMSQPSTIGAHFPGLNPLIYTAVSAVFLGILILVSIITCWIRSRKNTRLRSLLPQETPQDYLDYIQQGEFTPLTTSEFLASLRERPPTYNESEVIQRQLAEEGSTEDNIAPPLPPRNNSRRGSLIEASSHDSLGDLNTTQVLIENTETASSNETTPLPNETSTTLLPVETTSLPNLFPNDDFTLSFLLDDSSSVLREPCPLIDFDFEEDPTTVIPSETTSLLVGVIPSINNAVV